MGQRDFRICLVSGFVAICMLIGLVASAFMISNHMIDNANMQLQETRQLALDSYQMAVGKYYGNVHTINPDSNPDDNTIHLQIPPISDATESSDMAPTQTEPVEPESIVTEPIGTESVETDSVGSEPVVTEPIFDSTGDGEPSTGGDVNSGDSDTIVGDNVDNVVQPSIDPKPENTGWEEDEIFIDHMVMPGETLFSIAAIYGVDMYEIAEFNGIPDMNQIEAGQIFIIPVVNDWNEM